MTHPRTGLVDFRLAEGGRNSTWKTESMDVESPSGRIQNVREQHLSNLYLMACILIGRLHCDENYGFTKSKQAVRPPSETVEVISMID